MALLKSSDTRVHTNNRETDGYTVGEDKRDRRLSSDPGESVDSEM